MSILSLLFWELKLLNRYQLVGISIFISAMYAVLFFVFNIHDETIIILAVFSDPVMLGFMFTGVLILYDRNQHTNLALSVMPLSIRTHLLSRGLALTLLAECCSFAIILSGKGLESNLPIFFIAVAANSLLYYYIGIICLAGTDTFNGFIMRAAIMLAPLFIPLLSIIGIYDYAWFYVFPTMASIISFKAAMNIVSTGELLYAATYLTFLVIICGRVAEKIYKSKLICAR